MMLLFAILMLVNYTTDKDRFLFAYRISVGGLPINILDGLTLLGLALACFAMTRPTLEGERTHRGLYWVIGFNVLSIILGTVGAMINDVGMREVAWGVRSVGTLAGCVFIGYQVARTPAAAKWAAYVLLVSSALSAVVVLLFVQETGEALQTTGTSLDKLRNVSYGGDAGLLAAAFLCFALVDRVRVMPVWASLGVMLVGALGVYSLPHRSGWVMATGTLLFALLWLPRAPAGRKVRVAGGMVLLMAVVFGIAITAYSRATGRDFQKYLTTRVMSLLPGEQSGVKGKAWSTRTGPALVELQQWLKNPVMGQGFSIQAKLEQEMGLAGYGFRHNVWTASLAESGPAGWAGYMLPPILCMVVGFRVVRARTDTGTLLVGAMAAVHGCAAFLISFMSFSINLQRQAIPLGLMCGLVLRCRAMQLSYLEQYAGYVEPGQSLMDLEEEHAHADAAHAREYYV